MTAYRAALSSALQPFVNGGYLTQLQAGEIVQNVNVVRVTFFANIDLRLQGSTR